MSSELRGKHPAGMPSSLQYAPFSANVGSGTKEPVFGGGSSCGAEEVAYTAGFQTWQKWYDESGIAVPTITPGSEFELEVQMNADHGGQAWMMIGCGELIDESLDWTLLERAPSDRGHHLMPSNPTIYAWEQQSSGGMTKARYMVPASFSCPSGYAVGRWVWKTGNTCNDVNNIGRKTETFKLDEYAAVIAPTQARAECTFFPEHFINCFDFKIIGGNPNSNGDGSNQSNPTPSPLVSEANQQLAHATVALTAFILMPVFQRLW